MKLFVIPLYLENIVYHSTNEANRFYANCIYLCNGNFVITKNLLHGDVIQFLETLNACSIAFIFITSAQLIKTERIT
jgi:hypothetical protein